MYSVNYAVFVVYLLASMVFSPVVCVLTWRTWARARQRRLGPYLRWLTPSAIASSFTVVSILIYAVAGFLRIRSHMTEVLTYGLAACAIPFTVTASVRLWKMVRGMPIWAGDLLPPPGQPEEGVWPPPPEVR